MMDVQSTKKRRPPKKQPGQGKGPRTMNGLFLDVRTAAALLGETEKSLRAQVARRLIPYRRRGARIVFIRSEVEEWLMSLPGCTLEEARGNLEMRGDT